jgi:hypothetical protein
MALPARSEEEVGGELPASGNRSVKYVSNKENPYRY